MQSNNELKEWVHGFVQCDGFGGWSVLVLGDRVMTSICTNKLDSWRNGSTSDSISEGCAFGSSRVHGKIHRSWSAFTQTEVTNNLNHKQKWDEQHTIYVENPNFREKPREQNISLWEKTKYNHGMIKPDLVWACTETTISAERIKP